MKIEISQDLLLKSLKTVSRAVSGHTTLPVLGNILIRAQGKKVYFAATNLEISISTSTEAIVKNEGAITVPSKIFTSYVSLLKDDEDVELSAIDGSTLEVKSKSSKTKIKGISAEEFPAISRVEGGIKLEIECETYRSAVSQVAFSAQENSSRPILSGVLFAAEGAELRMVATDSYRLSEKKLELKTKVEKTQCVIPVRTVYEADRLAANADSVVLHVSENQVMFSFDGTELTSRLIEGQFPDYQQIIPKDFVTTLTVERNALSMGVRRVSIFAKENNQHMKLECTADGTLTVSTDMTQVGQDRTEMQAKIDGRANVIALNADYLLDGLSAIGGEKVNVFLKEKMNPAVIRPTDDESFIHLIMPLKM